MKAKVGLKLQSKSRIFGRSPSMILTYGMRMVRSKKFVLALAPLVGCPTSVDSFAPLPPSPSMQRWRNSISTSPHLLRSTDTDDERSTPLDRRNALQKILSLAFLSSSFAAVSVAPQQAEAASDLFKPNPLTNPVLEQMRIFNQDEVDNIKYGGELESGSAKPAAFDQYVQLLQPILTVERDLLTIDQLLNGKYSTNEDYMALFEKIEAILSNSLYDKINFKKAYNAFADNIYYSDPDRANLYLGGGAIPQNSQSIAYLLRNDVLTNVEDMRAEVAYLLKVLRKGEGELELEDILAMSKMGKEGMAKYLDLVPPKELAAARSKFTAA